MLAPERSSGPRGFWRPRTLQSWAISDTPSGSPGFIYGRCTLEWDRRFAGGERGRMGIVLRVTSGPHEGEEHRIDQGGQFVVGRSTRAAFPMPRDSALSRDHFQLEHAPPVCHLVDLGSTNGTKVNGLRVERV